MRHRMSHRGFSRASANRKAMFENLAAALLKHEQIRTTLPKAKDLRSIVERLITLGKRGGLHARRQVIAWLQDAKLADKLLTTLAERSYADKERHFMEVLGEEQGLEEMRDFERRVTLQALDRHWMEHLSNMDYLREGVHLRAMAQKDPLGEYRGEGHIMLK